MREIVISDVAGMRKVLDDLQCETFDSHSSECLDCCYVARSTIQCRITVYS
jgi:hypothetical protein